MGNSIESLPCALTEDEKAIKSKELCKALIDRAALEHDKKETTATFKKLIIAKDGEIDDLARVISTGVEYRPTECRDFQRFERNQIETVRMDTGEVVRARAMRVDERQTAMELEDEGETERIN